jgi:hypothetical protein
VGEGGEAWVELDADDIEEGVLAGDEEGSAFARTDIDEGDAFDGVRRFRGEPAVDEGAQDGGCHPVVGGDVLVVGMAGEEVFGGDEAAGLDAVGLVEGMDGLGGDLADGDGALPAWGGGHG